MAVAPKRIWAFFDGPMVGMFVGKEEYGTNVAEYVRAYEVARLRAERDELLEALRVLADETDALSEIANVALGTEYDNARAAIAKAEKSTG